MPVALLLMDEFHWLPDEIARMPHRLVMELLAMIRLKREVESRV